MATKLIRDHVNAEPPERYEDLVRVRQYADDMRDGVWESPDWGAYDNNPITVAGRNGWHHEGYYYPPGTIIDGWHRLNAIELSRVTVKAYLDLDWPEDVGTTV